jgi:hypothetical protein
MLERANLQVPGEPERCERRFRRAFDVLGNRELVVVVVVAAEVVENRFQHAWAGAFGRERQGDAATLAVDAVPGVLKREEEHGIAVRLHAVVC